ncbi:gas vesicle protein GvpG [Streptomyces exfoliatus]|uniref:Gas vesicle protein GvpG n=1 Tax=Streptomyces exfoliatus TaxID=1905 RepID=A0ABV3D184_STREX
MGLVTSILTLPLAPVGGTAWVLDQVILAAEREYYDPDRVRGLLAALEQELTSGRIEADEFDRREDELLDQLEEAEEYWRGSRNGR